MQVLTRTYNRAFGRSVYHADQAENTVKDPITGKVRGLLYKGPIDCLWKTFKAEGIAGWYKGTSACCKLCLSRQVRPRTFSASFLIRS